MDRPNVLFVIWDACRLDTARVAAPNLRELAQENLWFENAIAPAGTSLPSHVSMVTGQYPHEHGTFKQTHTIESSPLLAELGNRGYWNVGISANGFASAKYGFDRDFDQFYNTQGVSVYPEGLDPHGYARKVRERTGDEFTVDDVRYRNLVREILNHEHPLKSFANIAAAGLSEFVGRYPTLQRIPHRRFDKYNEFCYSPRQNTSLITDALDAATESNHPFFIFANYMDPHHPYAPPERYQQEYCGRTFSYRELDRLSELTHPLNYLERIQEEGQLTETTLQDVRGLYAGEVRTADEHLGTLLEKLDRLGIRDETLVVVTADHGENLGETNRMDETRMGHICSASEHHLRVPLVVAHPNLEARTITEYVSLKDLSELFIGGLETILETNGENVGALMPTDGMVSSQVTASYNSVIEQRHPELTEIFGRHISVVYHDDWKVVVTSNETEYAWKGGTEYELDEAPAAVTETCWGNLETIIEEDTSDRNLTDAEISHLEALGYLLKIL